ncbi:hypothetical protein pb186bvf_020034 [Paramecium bursaria]
MDSENEDTLGLKDQLNRIQERLMKLSTGLEFFQPNFVSSNTAHFGEDDIEEERSFQQLNCTYSTAEDKQIHQFKKPKPLFQVQGKGVKVTKMKRPKTPPPLKPKQSQKSIFNESPTQKTQRRSYYTQIQEFSPFCSAKPPIVKVITNSPTKSTNFTLKQILTMHTRPNSAKMRNASPIIFLT